MIAPGSERPNAFTLMELLLVMAVVLLLVGLTLPAFNKAAVNARSAKCLGNLRNLQSGIAAFTYENGGNLPTGRQVENRTVMWTEVLWPYLYSAKYVGYSGAELPKSLAGTVFECPEARFDRSRNREILNVRSYGMNHYAGDKNEMTGDLLLSLNDPSQTCLLADAQNEGQLRPYTLNPRHNGCFNVLYADGHVEALSDAAQYSDLYNHPFWGVVK